MAPPFLSPWDSFFFQAEDGIRDWSVTGVQTCALPICRPPRTGGRNGVQRPAFPTRVLLLPQSRLPDRAHGPDGGNASDVFPSTARARRTHPRGQVQPRRTEKDAEIGRAHV